MVHAPNHRGIKGTRQLIEAVAQFAPRDCGSADLLERRPNEQVRAAIRRSDIVADQFIAGYALFAIEGLSAENRSCPH